MPGTYLLWKAFLDTPIYRLPRLSPAPWLLTLLYLALLVAPLALAALASARERDFVGELATGTGLVALCMLLLQFISSGRYERVSGRTGIDATMRFHQLAAYALLAAALLHPLLFALPPTLAEWRSVPGGLWMMAAARPLRSGSVALALLVLLIVLAALRSRLKLRYEWWRGAHALTAAAAACGALHHAFSAGSYSKLAPVSAFWAVLGATALGSLAHVYVVKPWRLARSAWRVAANRRLGPDVVEIELEPAHGPRLTYQAGQFVWVSFGGAPFPLRDHPYSLASSPLEGERLRLMIKARGDFSGSAGDIAPGTAAYVDGPHGNFTLEGRPCQAIALFAGGIGIAPLLGIVRDLHLRADPRPVRLVYGTRNAARLVGMDVIAAAGQGLKLRADCVLEEPPPGWTGGVGAITPAVVARAVAGLDPAHCLCLLCGPAPMMLAVERALLDLGVPGGNIVFERFDYA